MDEFKTIPANIFNIELRRNYPVFEEEYQDKNIPVKDLQEKYGNTQYHKLYKEFVARGFVPRCDKRNPKYYHHDSKTKKWMVRKRINGVMTYFGQYNSEAQAKRRVTQLKKNGWKKKK